MKANQIIWPLALLGLLAGCSSSQGGNAGSGSTPVASSSKEDASTYQMIVDNTWQEGFSCDPGSGSNPDTGYFPENRWGSTVDLTYKDDAKPVWIMSQHGDIYSLNDHYNKYTGDRTVECVDGYYTFYDESKKVAANPTTGSLYLELNASKEYERPRKNGEQWCHLLLNEGFKKAVSTSEIDSCIFSADMTLKKFEDHMDGQANSNVHAAQFLMYLVVKSSNGAEDSGFFWFGIPFFDNRYASGLPESGMVDAGGAGATGKFIYSCPSAEYIDDGILPLGETVHIEFDITSYLNRGLLMAQKSGYFTKSSYNDLVFQSMNIGFELPGTYDIGVEISSFELTANYKE